MKKDVFFMLVASMLLIYSCSDDNESNSTTPETANLEIQNTGEIPSIALEKEQWKSVTISNEIVTRQQGISHYEFDIVALQTLIDTKDVNYIWFDVGLTRDNLMTFTATAENKFEEIVGQVTSQAITQQKSKTDFSILNQVKSVEPEIAPLETHILPNQFAYEYLTSMDKAYSNFEQLLLHDGERVERFGLNPVIVQRMLNTKGINTLALFLGQNYNDKLTTVFIAKDKGGNLLIDDSDDVNTSGKAFDFTQPCPNFCDPDSGCCIERCGPFNIFCCDYEDPCPDDEDE